MNRTPYTKGLVPVANGIHAYLQPDGSWGYSNAGLIEDSGQSLLVDTLFDRRLTREMLEAMRKVSTSGGRIGTVVNTHANGDHCWGNVEVKDARIIASRKAAHEMTELPPARVAAMVLGAKAVVASGPVAPLAARMFRAAHLAPLADVLDAAPFVARIFAGFDFSHTPLVKPTQTFEGTLDVQVGNRTVQLIEVGPAHTSGDVMAWIPDARTVFTGDILFIEGHPIVWEGPLSNWVKALDAILALNAEVIVPGHGPMTDSAGVKRLREYLAYVDTEATKRHAAGMDAETAAKDIALDAFRGWSDAERIAVNVDTVYRHLEGRTGKVNVVRMFARMARVARAVQ